MRHGGARVSVVIVVLAALVAVAACGGSPNRQSEGSGQSQPGQVKVLVYASRVQPAYVDPAMGVDHQTLKVIRNVYEPLVQEVFGSTELEPALAESWTTNEDFTEYTFTLREGVTFHDGTRWTPRPSSCPMSAWSRWPAAWPRWWNPSSPLKCWIPARCG